MTLRGTLARIVAQEDINFLLTNRIPRRLATRLAGWLSKIEQPLVRDASLWIWRLFSDLDLSEAKTTRFRSLHDCFTRELKDGARPVAAAPSILVSPCDAIVGASGPVEGTRVFQVKGFPYSLSDLLPDQETVNAYRGGVYATLRLTASMYHRFHAPHDCRGESVTYVSGDTWNVNPIALKRVEALFCKNELAVLRTRLLATGDRIALVPVAAILVASLRFRFFDGDLDLRQGGPRTIPCDAILRKGEEIGWFQHGSTIIVLAPPGFALLDGIREGARLRMGEPLMRLPERPPLSEASA